MAWEARGGEEVIVPDMTRVVGEAVEALEQRLADLDAEL